MSSPPAIKIYGERNTGTNYLSKLIHLNIDVRELSGIAPPNVVRLQNRLPGKEWVKDLFFKWTFGRHLGWKHTCVKEPAFLKKQPVSADGVNFITMTKNPYSWLLSLYKRPYHNQPESRTGEFAAFLREPYQSKGRDNVPKRLSSPIELWNLKNRSYLALKDEFPTANLKYESLLESPKNTMVAICDTFKMEWDADGFKNFEASTKDSDKDADFYRRYYLEEEWRKNLTPQSIEMINELVDQELMDQFGYETLTG